MPENVASAIAVIRWLYLLIALITLADFLRHRDRTRLDIALMFAAITMAVALLTLPAGIDWPWLNVIGPVSVVAQPYLLLRLAQLFQPVPRRVQFGSLIALIIMVILVLLPFSPRPVWLVLIAITYFGFLELYATAAFFRGARRMRGVSRWRLMLAAGGSTFFGGIILLAGLTVLLPDLIDPITPLAVLLFALAPLSYYLGFAPPRWLRLAWQHAELRRFLSEIVGQSVTVRAVSMNQILGESAMRTVGGIAAAIARQDAGNPNILALSDQHLEMPVTQLDADAGIAGKVWRSHRPLTVRRLDLLSPPEARLAAHFGAEAVLVIPITISEQTWGLLLVFLLRPPLFDQDDLELLALLAEQAALIFSYEALLAEQQALVEQLRQQHHQLQQAHHEIKQLNLELERRVQERTAQLAGVNKDLEAFAYTVSHDLRAPLRALQSYSQFLQEDCSAELNSSGQEYVRGIAESAREMDTLIVDLLEYSRIGRIRVELGPVNCAQLLQKVVARMGWGEEVTVNLPADAPTVWARQTRLEQIFSNLLSNAGKFRRPGVPPVIDVEWADLGSAWAFTVRDNGIGIASQHLTKIFGIFQRLHAQDQYEGTGIGLAIVQKAVEEHNGQVSVRSIVGQGSEFTFTLPKSEEGKTP